MEWSAEEEIELFKALRGLKPIGINKHFFMACICERLAIALKRPINPDVVWAHLGTMYNLELLDSLEPLPFSAAQRDFELPADEESGFAQLMEAKSAKKSASGGDEEEDVEADAGEEVDAMEVEADAAGGAAAAEKPLVVGAAAAAGAGAGGDAAAEGSSERSANGPKPLGKSVWTRKTEANQRVIDELKAVLEFAIAPEPELTPERLAQLLKMRPSLICTARTVSCSPARAPAPSSSSTSNKSRNLIALSKSLSEQMMRLKCDPPICKLEYKRVEEAVERGVAREVAAHHAAVAAADAAANAAATDAAADAATAAAAASAAASSSATTSSRPSKPQPKRTRGSKSIESNSPSTTPPPNAAQNKRRRN